jgi:hypothetical protein
MGDYRNAVTTNNVASARNQGIVLIRWILPKPLFVMLNTAGAYKDHQIAGCGEVIRGNDGEWLGGFAKAMAVSLIFLPDNIFVLKSGAI